MIIYKITVKEPKKLSFTQGDRRSKGDMKMSKGFINKMTKGIAVVLALSLLMVQGTFAGDRFHKASDGSETAVPAYDASGHLIGKGSGSKEASAHIMNDPVVINPA